MVSTLLEASLSETYNRHAIRIIPILHSVHDSIARLAVKSAMAVDKVRYEILKS